MGANKPVDAGDDNLHANSGPPTRVIVEFSTAESASVDISAWPSSARAVCSWPWDAESHRVAKTSRLWTFCATGTRPSGKAGEATVWQPRPSCQRCRRPLVGLQPRRQKGAVSASWFLFVSTCDSITDTVARGYFLLNPAGGFGLGADADRPAASCRDPDELVSEVRAQGRTRHDAGTHHGRTLVAAGGLCNAIGACRASDHAVRLPFRVPAGQRPGADADSRRARAKAICPAGASLLARGRGL